MLATRFSRSGAPGGLAAAPAWRRPVRSAVARRLACRLARPGLLLAVLAALAGCALVRGRPPEDRLTVDLAVSRADAVRRTLAAFREQGYRVRATLTSGTEPETEPFRHGDDTEAVFRAAISGTGRAARVVFSGTYRRRELGGLVRGREHAVRRTDDAPERELWARLDDLARAVRRGAP
jgi:hypothetical protein